MAIDNEVMHILGAAASVAASFGLTKPADEIVSALRELSPEDENVKMLHAMTCIQGNEFDRAKSILTDEVLAANAENLQAKSLLGLVHHLQKNMAERNSVLQAVLDAADGADDDAVAIAKELMTA